MNTKRAQNNNDETNENLISSTGHSHLKNASNLEIALDEAIEQAKYQAESQEKQAAQEEYRRTYKKAELKIKSEKLVYISEMLAELKKLSLEMDETMIAYLIDMAILEVQAKKAEAEFSVELGENSE